MGDVFRQDCRHALTGLVRSPGFTATAVVTLALSLGATVTLFSLLNALTLRTLPVPHPEQLVHVATGLRSGAEAPLSFPMFRELSSRQTLLASTFGWFGDPVLSIEVDGGLTQGTVIGVSGNFHSELGATAAAGRLLQPSDVDLTTFTGAQVAVMGTASG
jgi:MacB-like periplasmic core domain